MLASVIKVTLSSFRKLFLFTVIKTVLPKYLKYYLLILRPVLTLVVNGEHCNTNHTSYKTSMWETLECHKRGALGFPFSSFGHF